MSSSSENESSAEKASSSEEALSSEKASRSKIVSRSEMALSSEKVSTNKKVQSISFDKPSTSFDKPSTSFDKPSTSFDKPSTSFDKPSTSFDKPSTSFDEPSTSFDKPSTSFGEPSTSFDTQTTSFTLGSTTFNMGSSTFDFVPSFDVAAVFFDMASKSYDLYTHEQIVPAFSKCKTSLKEVIYRQENFSDIEKVFCKNIMCTSCGKSVNNLVLKGKPIVHPVLDTLVCKNCRLFYGNEPFKTDEDGSARYCIWCGQGGLLFLCSKCPSGFCKRCIKRNLPRKERALIHDDDWVCYCCNTEPIYDLRAECWAAKLYADKCNKRRTSATRKRYLNIDNTSDSEGEGDTMNKKKTGRKKGAAKRRYNEKKTSCGKNFNETWGKNSKKKDPNSQTDKCIQATKLAASEALKPFLEPAVTKLSGLVVEAIRTIRESHKSLVTCRHQTRFLKNDYSLDTVINLERKITHVIDDLEENLHKTKLELKIFAIEWKKITDAEKEKRELMHYLANAGECNEVLLK